MPAESTSCPAGTGGGGGGAVGTVVLAVVGGGDVLDELELDVVDEVDVVDVLELLVDVRARAGRRRSGSTSSSSPRSWRAACVVAGATSAVDAVGTLPGVLSDASGVSSSSAITNNVPPNSTSRAITIAISTASLRAGLAATGKPFALSKWYSSDDSTGASAAVLASTRSRSASGAASAGAAENSGTTAHLRLVSPQISQSSTWPAMRLRVSSSNTPFQLAAAPAGRGSRCVRSGRR